MISFKSIFVGATLTVFLSFTACSSETEDIKDEIVTLLKGKPSEKNYDLSQKYFDEGDYEKALKHDILQLEEDLKYYKKQSSEISLDYNNIGLDYDELKNYSKALEYYKKAIKIDEITLESNSTERSTTYYNIASTYDSLDNYDEALKYYFKALEIDKVGLGLYHEDVLAEYEDIATVYEKTDKPQKALVYLEKALEFNLHEHEENSDEVAESKAKIEELKKKIK